jgi:hypothetical protein
MLHFAHEPAWRCIGHAIPCAWCSLLQGLRGAGCNVGISNAILRRFDPYATASGRRLQTSQIKFIAAGVWRKLVSHRARTRGRAASEQSKGDRQTAEWKKSFHDFMSEG